MMTARTGALLVAMPMLTDPNFDRTVVYLLEQEPSGTVGVVLNRPSDTELLDILPGWWSLAAAPRTFHVGGPCETDTALCLALGNPPKGATGLRAVGDSVHLVDLDSDPAVTGAGLDRLRIFAGYAGWGRGQLQKEIAEGAWAVVASRPSDVIADVRADGRADGQGDGQAGTGMMAGVRLWREVLRRQGGTLAMLSTYPDDASLN